MRLYAGPIVGQPNGQRLVARRRKLETLKSMFPHRAEEFDGMIREIDVMLTTMPFCRRCGRLLKKQKHIESGYGPECQQRSLSESAGLPEQGRTP